MNNFVNTFLDIAYTGRQCYFQKGGDWGVEA